MSDLEDAVSDVDEESVIPESRIAKESFSASLVIDESYDDGSIERDHNDESVNEASNIQQWTRQKKKIHILTSDDSDSDTRDNMNESNSDAKSDEDLNVQNKKNSKAINSDSDFDEEKENSAPNQQQSPAAADPLNLSVKMATSRMSQQFRFNSEGILNSTANFTQPRQTQEIVDSSVEIQSENDSDVIEVSSEEESSFKQFLSPFKRPALKVQQTLHSFVKKEPQYSTPSKIEPPKPTKNPVSNDEYQQQQAKVNSLQMDLVKLTDMMETVAFENLPDKGKLLQERFIIAQRRLEEQQKILQEMEVDEGSAPVTRSAFDNITWGDIEAGADAVLPKTFGKKALSTYNNQKAITLDRLQQLHGALQTCPKEEDMEDDPEGLKVALMPHQKRALAWLLFREKENPSGGILADDMGLGKTLTMLALIQKCVNDKSKADSDEEDAYVGKSTRHVKHNGGSLIVCPASLLNQWSGEIEKHLKRGRLSYLVYHGPKRETRAKKLAEYDVVITTYAIIGQEANQNSAAFRVKWARVILDEAHQIRNHKSQMSVGCCALSARSRWALTGTPMHNKELDMYALLKFLRCSPFDDLQVWKRWVGDKSTGGQERLHTVISSLMLRRTKVELMEKGSLTCMPEKKWELVDVRLDKSEMQIYHKILIFSQTLFAQFLHQRAEKNQEYVDQNFPNRDAPNEEYVKMRQKLLKLNKVKNVSQHEILVLLLRLRQICCHPSLITGMLDDCKEEIDEEDEEREELNILEQINNLNLEDAPENEEDEFKPDQPFAGISNEEKVTLKEASRGHLNPSDPVFSTERASSKIKTMLKLLKEKVMSKDDKAIIVSQWSSYLKLIAKHLEKEQIVFDQLDGSVPVHKRMEMVNNFNNPAHSMRILLLSLTAGGVGLNLVGANHLFLLDLHWNPQLENQAQDRIYRVGQKKPVFVYKFMAVDTIEERIKGLQDSKLRMADAMLTGTKLKQGQGKLSLEDLRMIFGM